MERILLQQFRIKMNKFQRDFAISYIQSSPARDDRVHASTGCAFSGHPLVRGDWKCWWATGWLFNGRPPGKWKFNNSMVVREFIICCVIKHHSGSPMTIGNFIW